MNWLVNFFYKTAISKDLKNRIALIKVLEKARINIPLSHFDYSELVSAISLMRKSNDKATCDEEGNIYFYYEKKDKKGNNKLVRDKTKLSKYLKQNLGVEISNSGLSDITKYVKGNISSQMSLYTPSPPSQHEKEEIQDKYDSFTGQYSCMVGHKNLTELYALNPDKVKLLTYGNSAKTLIWYCDDGSVVMDRIYGNPIYVRRFLQYAKNNNIIPKENPTTKDGKFKDGARRTVTLNNFGEYFPYLDTFSTGDFYDENDNKCSEKDAVKLVLNNYGEGDCEFEKQDGTYSIEKAIGKCVECGERITEDDLNEDAYFSDDVGYVCGDCYGTNYFHCENCSEITNLSDGKEAPENKYGYKPWLCKYCFDNKYSKCFVCDKIANQEDVWSINNNFVERTKTYIINHNDYNKNIIEKIISDGAYYEAACDDCVKEAMPKFDEEDSVDTAAE